jgi:hypothetical protein
MAHFAKIGTGNIVLRVHTIHNNEAPTEEAGQEFLRRTHKNKDTYKQTSYNTYGGVHTLGGTPFRKNYAGIGYQYDQTRDAFIAPKPYPSWILNEDTCLWESPVAYPDDGKDYEWNEETTNWVEFIPTE